MILSYIANGWDKLNVANNCLKSNKMQMVFVVHLIPTESRCCKFFLNISYSSCDAELISDSFINHISATTTNANI